MKQVKYLSSLLLLFILSTTLALPWTSNKKAPKTEQTSSTQGHAISLYEKADKKSQVLGSVLPSQSWVKIFQKDGWLKIGDTQNGLVGWINQKDYQEMLKNWYAQKTRTLFIHVDEKEKDGKVETHFVAYRNGKKVDEKEAKALYEKWQKQQNQAQKSMENFMKQMNAYFNQENERFTRSFFESFPIIQPVPVIIIEKNPNNVQKTDKDK